MARHEKSVNISMTTTAQRKAWRDGPACERCKHLVCVPDARCGKGHELGDGRNCPDYKDASVASPTVQNAGGNGR
jgi:hypothetical protein